MLRNKKDIQDYDKKSKFLKENGWTDLWHVDNWVKIEWFGHPAINIDMVGCSIDIAYDISKKSKK